MLKSFKKWQPIVEVFALYLGSTALALLFVGSWILANPEAAKTAWHGPDSAKEMVAYCQSPAVHKPKLSPNSGDVCQDCSG
jgi:hypothetical protein